MSKHHQGDNTTGYIEYRDIDDLIWDLNIIIDVPITDELVERIKKNKRVTISRKGKDGSLKTLELILDN